MAVEETEEGEKVAEEVVSKLAEGVMAEKEMAEVVKEEEVEGSKPVWEAVKAVEEEENRQAAAAVEVRAMGE